jgi:hypothetical protein
MRRSEAGQSAVVILMALSLLFGAVVASFQAVGFGFRTLQLQDAAAAGSQAMAHGLRIGNQAAVPCWTAGDGLEHPANYADAQVCRAVVANLGPLDYHRATVRVSQQGMDATGRPASFTAYVSYREPVSSPLLRLFVGPDFTSTAEATAGAY